MSNDFRPRAAALLSNLQAAKQKSEDDIREMYECKERARADFDRLRDDLFHPVMQELAAALKARGDTARPQQQRRSAHGEQGPAVTRV